MDLRQRRRDRVQKIRLGELGKCIIIEMSLITSETILPKSPVLELFLGEKKLDGFTPFLKAVTDEEVSSVLNAGKLLIDDKEFKGANADFYELLRRVTGIFTPHGGSNTFGSTDYWGNLLEDNYQGSLGVDDYRSIVETTNRIAEHLVIKNIHSLALPPVQHWLEKHVSIVPILLDAKKRYSLLVEAPKVVGELPYYLVHDNNRKDKDSILLKINDAFFDLFNGEFNKVDRFAFDVGTHRYSFRHIQQMVDNFVRSVRDESRNGQFIQDHHEVLESVTGLEMRDLIRRKLVTIRSFEDAGRRLERIKSHLLYRSEDNKSHAGEYPLAFTTTYESIINEIDGVEDGVGYEQGVKIAEEWVASARLVNEAK